jgi:hypothetical protein
VLLYEVLNNSQLRAIVPREAEDRNGNKFVLEDSTIYRTGIERRDMTNGVPQLCQWDRSNPRYLVDAPFALLVCSLHTNSVQGFLNLKK